LSETISWLAVRELYDAASAGRKKLAELYLDAVSLRRIEQDVSDCPKAMPPASSTSIHSRNATWECCAMHRVLSAASHDIGRRARELTVVKSEGQPGSETWWKDHGFNIPSGRYSVVE
jgi:hypothetical protein